MSVSIDYKKLIITLYLITVQPDRNMDSSTICEPFKHDAMKLFLGVMISGGICISYFPQVSATSLR